MLWVSERPAQRIVFHLSGRRRAECLLEGPWDGPPRTQLVLIGADPQALQRLCARFLKHVVCRPVGGREPAGSPDHGRDGDDDEAVGAAEAAAMLSGRIAAHERLRLVTAATGAEAGARPAAAAAGESGAGGPAPQQLVEFSCRGSQLHGIREEALNAEVLLRANAQQGASGLQHPPLLLVGVTGHGALSAATGVHGRDRCVPC